MRRRWPAPQSGRIVGVDELGGLANTPSVQAHEEFREYCGPFKGCSHVGTVGPKRRLHAHMDPYDSSGNSWKVRVFRTPAGLLQNLPHTLNSKLYTMHTIGRRPLGYWRHLGSFPRAFMKLHAQAPRLHIEDPFLLERPSFPGGSGSVVSG